MCFTWRYTILLQDLWTATISDNQITSMWFALVSLCMYLSINRYAHSELVSAFMSTVWLLSQLLYSEHTPGSKAGYIYLSPRSTTKILTQLAEVVVSHSPWVGQSAGLWCSSPEQCVDGHSAWLPLVPCESPQAAVFHLLLLVPVTPLSPGNAEKTINHNREDISIREHLCPQTTKNFPRVNVVWLPETLRCTHLLLISAGTAVPCIQEHLPIFY